MPTDFLSSVLAPDLYQDGTRISPRRKNINFRGMTVEDDPSTGATNITVDTSVLAFVTGDGSDETALLQAAVDDAIARGAGLLWPAIEVTTTASIAGLHTVRHTGPGVILRDGNEFHVDPRPGDENTLYCDADASDDLGDGLSANDPIQQIRTAVDHLENYGPFLDGSWYVRAAAGTYKGGIQFGRNLQSRDLIRIIGPSVGGHPNVPTAIIDKAADTGETRGILLNDGILLWLEEVKFTGAFLHGLSAQRNCYVNLNNVHADGCDIGWQFTNHCRYFVTGGIIENCDNGVGELFGIVRAYQGEALADGPIIRDCDVGLKAKENCVGHTDYITFEDNGTGMELQLFSGTNPKGASFKRNGAAIVLNNSEIHNESRVSFGTGADANGVTILSLGNSSEIYNYGWVAAGGDPALRTGHRPLVLLKSAYGTTTHTGTVAETDLFLGASELEMGMYAVQGKKYKMLVRGQANNLMAGTARLLLRTGGTFMTDVTIPAGTASGADFVAEFEVICSADGNTQRVSSWLLVDGQLPDVTSLSRTTTMDDADHSANISAILANSADSVSLHVVELWG